MRKSRRKLLVVGHERSGTGFMAAILRHLGLHIGHEQVYNDGISAAQFAHPDCMTLSGHYGREFEFERTILVVRDPIKVLDSAFYTIGNPNLPGFHGQYYPTIEPKEPTVDGFISSIVGWNELARNMHGIDAVVQIEHATEILPELLEKWNWHGKPAHNPAPARNFNARPRPADYVPFTWETLPERASESHLWSLADWAGEAGYEAIDPGGPISDGRRLAGLPDLAPESAHIESTASLEGNQPPEGSQDDMEETGE